MRSLLFKLAEGRELSHVEKSNVDAVVRWVHISAVVLRLGGVGFAVNVLFPSMGVLSEEGANALSGQVFPRFTTIAWVVMATITVTALLMIIARWPISLKERYGKTLVLKVVLALVWVLNNISVLLGIQGPGALRFSFFLGIVIVLVGALLTKTPRYAPQTAQP